MQITFLSYALAAIMSFLGIIVGIILIKMAPEEQKPGKKYFIFLRMLFFLFMIAAFLFFYRISLIFSSALVVFIVALMLNRKLHLEKASLVYLLLGFLFYFSSKIFSLFVIESALIFLYGIPSASLAISPKARNYMEVFATKAWFFLPVLALYLLRL